MSNKTLIVPRSLGREVSLAAGAVSTLCNRLLEPHGLSLAQWAVLSSLWHNGPLSVKDLSVMTGNTGPATTRIVDRMIASDLVRRRPDPADRRAVIVDLSDRGEELRSLESFFEDVNAILTEGMAEADANRLFDLLKTVQGNARRATEDSR